MNIMRELELPTKEQDMSENLKQFSVEVMVGFVFGLVFMGLFIFTATCAGV